MILSKRAMGAGGFQTPTGGGITDPSDISGLLFWGKPDDAASITRTGDTVDAVANQILVADEPLAYADADSGAAAGLKWFVAGATDPFNGTSYFSGNGSNGGKETLQAEDDLVHPFSFCAVFQAQDATEGQQWLVGPRGSNAPNISALRVTQDDVILDAGTALTAAAAITIGAPHFIVGVVNGVSSKIYVDNVEVASGDAGSNGYRGFAFAGNYSQSFLIDGYMGDVLFFNKGLSVSEVDDLSAYYNTTQGTGYS